MKIYLWNVLLALQHHYTTKTTIILGFVVSGFCLILEKVTRFELTPTVYCGLLYTYKSISMKTMTKKNYL